MEPAPRLLKTYQEARLLFEAKGWALAKAAEHLAELPEMAPFHISHTKLSKKTTPSKAVPIEPEVAAAIEGLKTWGGRERQTAIVIAGLLALHSDPTSVELVQVATEVRELTASEPTLKLAEALEQKAGQRVTAKKRFGRAFRTRISIAASGALVGCLAVLVALLAGATRPGPLMLIVAGAGPDGAPVQFDPRSLFDNVPAAWGEQPLDQPIPLKTLPGQKVAPCNSALGEEAINGNCWAAQAKVKPPCGLLFRQGDFCYRPISADPKKPTP